MTTLDPHPQSCSVIGCNAVSIAQLGDDYLCETDILKYALLELERLQDVLLPHYEGKVAEPDADIIGLLKWAIQRREV